MIYHITSLMAKVVQMNRFSIGIIFLLFTLSCEKKDPLLDLQEAITTKLNGQPGTYALAFKDINNPERTLLINEKESFHAASTMKTPVMIELFKQAEMGNFELTDSILVKNEFYSIVDSSTYQMDIGEDSEEELYAMIGRKATILDLTYDMITYSSNLATNILIDKVGAQNVTQTMRDLGAMDIQVLRGVEDIKAYEKGLSNSTTAYDLMLIYEALAKGAMVNPEACQQMIDILLEQQFNEIIPAHLPEEVKVAHKTGWISTANHDSGIVILPDGRQYVLVLLSKNWDSSENSTALLAELSEMVYKYYVGEEFGS